MSARTTQHGSHTRWRTWQQTPMVQKLLGQDWRDRGYTAIWVPRECRDEFLEVMELLHRYAQLCKEARVTSEQRLSWAHWGAITRQFAAYLRRACAQKPATSPEPLQRS